MDIRCRKTGCQYNDRYTCKAKDILIKKNMECGQYVKGNKPVDKTKWLFSEKPPEYAPQRDSATIGIGCKAHCLFNDNGKCVANGITLNDIHEKPLCVTYLRK
ncbi:MAG: DUF1540 domain-containing protein [Candidatus Caccovivens sp.]